MTGDLTRAHDLSLRHITENLFTVKTSLETRLFFLLVENSVKTSLEAGMLFFSDDTFFETD